MTPREQSMLKRVAVATISKVFQQTHMQHTLICHTYLMLLAYFSSNGHQGQYLLFSANKKINFQWISALLGCQNLAYVFGPGYLFPFYFFLPRSLCDVHVCPDGLPCPLHQHHNMIQKATVQIIRQIFCSLSSGGSLFYSRKEW